jgi:hypothetical protein
MPRLKGAKLMNFYPQITQIHADKIRFLPSAAESRAAKNHNLRGSE